MGLVHCQENMIRLSYILLQFLLLYYSCVKVVFLIMCMLNNKCVLDALLQYRVFLDLTFLLSLLVMIVLLIWIFEKKTCFPHLVFHLLVEKPTSKDLNRLRYLFPFRYLSLFLLVFLSTLFCHSFSTLALFNIDCWIFMWVL